jgi:hypothetical protein
MQFSGLTAILFFAAALMSSLPQVEAHLQLSAPVVHYDTAKPEVAQQV